MHDERTRSARALIGTRAYADAGADLILAGPDGALWVVQCKRFDHPSDAWPARYLPDDLREYGAPASCLLCARAGSDVDERATNITIAASGAFLTGGDSNGYPDVDPGTRRTAVWMLTPVRPARPVDSLGRVSVEWLALELAELFKHWEAVAHRPRAVGPSLAELVHRACTSGPLILNYQVPRPGRGGDGHAEAVRSARCAVRAAYAARDAVVTGDPDVIRDSVGHFLEHWLGLPPTPARIAAAAHALLLAELKRTDPDHDHAIVLRLPRDILQQRRALRWLTETTLRHCTIDSLDRPLAGLDDGELLTVADTVGVEQDMIGALQWGDERIPRVLAQLHPDERRVAVAYALAGGTWPEAAIACELPDAYGERVRRKLQRLGRQLTDRRQTRQHAA